LPPSAAEAKKAFDAKVAARLKPNMELRYEAEPEFDIQSVIPSRVVMTVTGDDDEFTETIEVGPLAPKAPELEADPEPIPPIAQVLAAFKEPEQRPRLSPVYRLGLAGVALILTLMLSLYIGGTLACLGFGIKAGLDAMSGGASGLLAEGPIALACLVLFLFMVKPFLSLVRRRPEPYAVTEDDEPDLFAFVHRICEIVGTAPPKRILLTCQVNASVSYRRRLFSMVTNDIDLSIGLPLVYGLNLQQLAGVIAHETGHFAQRSGRGVSFCVNTLCYWFGRVVYERDFIDDKLAEIAQRAPLLVPGIFLVNLLSAIPRAILRVLRHIGYLMSCFFIRQMEYNADSFEVMVSGSKCFERTTWRLCLLNAAAELSQAGLQQAYREGRLSDNLPLLVAMNERLIKVDERRRLRSSIYRPGKEQFDPRTGEPTSGLLATHPTDLKRIKAARRLDLPGLFDHSGPALGLFGDISRHGKAITTRYYRFVLKGRYKRSKIVDSSVIVEQLKEMITAYSARDRCCAVGR
jgi:Zn-dependent protease with chaperone function